MAQENSKLAALRDLGQSVWLDFISRDLLTIRRTCRPCRGGGRRHDHQPDRSSTRRSTEGSELRRPDPRAGAPWRVDGRHRRRHHRRATCQTACDLLLPVYERTHHDDGYVSIEVPPALAYDTDKTIAEAHRLWDAVDRPERDGQDPWRRRRGSRPSAVPGRRAQHQHHADVLDRATTRQVADAYLSGLEDRVAARREPIDEIALGGELLRVPRRHAGRSRRSKTCWSASTTRSCASAWTASRARSAWPTRKLVYEEFLQVIRDASAGIACPSAARTRSACCGRARAPRTRPTATCSTSTS